jgi:O-phosphoseryl-tRNA(Cys) synthetase
MKTQSTKKELIKEIRFHLRVYDEGTIDGDDLANAVEEIINEK